MGICELRSDAYFCFSLCFDYPTATLIEPATANIISNTVDRLPKVIAVEAFREAADLFRSEVIRSGDLSGVPLLHLQIEYNRLFAGPSKPQAYPYEQAFLNQSGWSVDSGRSLAREYLDGGLKLAPGFKDSPDHISLEFEFMSHLCEREMTEGEARDSQRAGKYRLQQRSFLENHIVNWVPAFLATVERSAVLAFYKSLARIARGFVVWDYERVQDPGGRRIRSHYVYA